MTERVHAGVFILSEGKLDTPPEGTLARAYTRVRSLRRAPAPVLRVKKTEIPEPPPKPPTPPPRQWWSRFVCW